MTTGGRSRRARLSESRSHPSEPPRISSATQQPTTLLGCKGYRKRLGSRDGRPRAFDPVRYTYRNVVERSYKATNQCIRCWIVVRGFSPNPWTSLPIWTWSSWTAPTAWLAHFYSRLLGWPVEVGADDAFATLTPPGGGVSPDNPNGRTTLAFQRIDDRVAPTWPGGAQPQQFHLDVSVGDIDAADPLVLALGARVHEHQPAEDGGLRVYLDPVGHPFCLIR